MVLLLLYLWEGQTDRQALQESSEIAYLHESAIHKPEVAADWSFGVKCGRLARTVLERTRARESAAAAVTQAVLNQSGDRVEQEKQSAACRHGPCKQKDFPESHVATCTTVALASHGVDPSEPTLVLKLSA